MEEMYRDLREREQKVVFEGVDPEDYRLQWLAQEIGKHLDVTEEVVQNMMQRYEGKAKEHIMDLFRRGTGRSTRALERTGFYVYKTYFPKMHYKQVIFNRIVPKREETPKEATPEPTPPPKAEKKTLKRKKKKKAEVKPVDLDLVELFLSKVTSSNFELGYTAPVSEEGPIEEVAYDEETINSEIQGETDGSEEVVETPSSRKRKKKKKKVIKEKTPSLPKELEDPKEPEMINVTFKRIIKYIKYLPQIHFKTGDVSLNFKGEQRYFYFLLTTYNGVPVMDTLEEANAEMPAYFLIGQLDKDFFNSFESMMLLLEEHFALNFNDAFSPIPYSKCQERQIQNTPWNIPPVDVIRSSGGFARRMIKILTQIKYEDDDDEDELLPAGQYSKKPTVAYSPQEIVKGYLQDYPEGVREVFKKIRAIQEIKADPDYLTKKTIRYMHPLYNAFVKKIKTLDYFVMWCYKNMENKMMMEMPDLPELENANKKMIYKMSQDKDYVMALEDIVDSWAQYILYLLEAVREKNPGGNGPMPLYDYWALRATAFSPIYEALHKPIVGKILKVLTLADSSVPNNFLYAREAIAAYYNISLENTDYLNTAITEIRLLMKCKKVSEMAHILPQVFEHIRILWVLSSHWGAEVHFSQLLERIKWVVETKIKRILNVKELFTVDLDVIKKACLSCVELMAFWKIVYLKTREMIEQTNCEVRWDFDKNQLFKETDYIAYVAKTLSEMVTVVHEYLSIFCPEFVHSVIESSPIRNIIKRIRNLTIPIITADFDIFHPMYASRWNFIVEDFWLEMENMEHIALGVIQHAFKHLRSSGGAVSLLILFQKVQIRGRIYNLLMTKMDDVLTQFREEIINITETFAAGSKDPPIMRKHPVFAGGIAWTRHLLATVRSSLQGINEILDDTQSGKKEQTYREFQQLVDLLKAYENVRFKEWVMNDMPCLKRAFRRNILKLAEVTPDNSDDELSSGEEGIIKASMERYPKGKENTPNLFNLIFPGSEKRKEKNKLKFEESSIDEDMSSGSKRLSLYSSSVSLNKSKAVSSKHRQESKLSTGSRRRRKSKQKRILASQSERSFMKKSSDKVEEFNYDTNSSSDSEKIECSVLYRKPMSNRSDNESEASTLIGSLGADYSPDEDGMYLSIGGVSFGVFRSISKPNHTENEVTTCVVSDVDTHSDVSHTEMEKLNQNKIQIYYQEPALKTFDYNEEKDFKPSKKRAASFRVVNKKKYEKKSHYDNVMPFSGIKEYDVDVIFKKPLDEVVSALIAGRYKGGESNFRKILFATEKKNGDKEGKKYHKSKIYSTHSEREDSTAIMNPIYLQPSSEMKIVYGQPKLDGVEEQVFSEELQPMKIEPQEMFKTPDVRKDENLTMYNCDSDSTASSSFASVNDMFDSSEDDLLELKRKEDEFAFSSSDTSSDSLDFIRPRALLEKIKKGRGKRKKTRVRRTRKLSVDSSLLSEPNIKLSHNEIWFSELNNLQLPREKSASIYSKPCLTSSHKSNQENKSGISGFHKTIASETSLNSGPKSNILHRETVPGKKDAVQCSLRSKKSGDKTKNTSFALQNDNATDSDHCIELDDKNEINKLDEKPVFSLVKLKYHSKHGKESKGTIDGKSLKTKLKYHSKHGKESKSTIDGKSLKNKDSTFSITLLNGKTAGREQTPKQQNIRHCKKVSTVPQQPQVQHVQKVKVNPKHTIAKKMRLKLLSKRQGNVLYNYKRVDYDTIVFENDEEQVKTDYFNNLVEELLDMAETQAFYISGLDQKFEQDLQALKLKKKVDVWSLIWGTLPGEEPEKILPEKKMQGSQQTDDTLSETPDQEKNEELINSEEFQSLAKAFSTLSLKLDDELDDTNTVNTLYLSKFSKRKYANKQLSIKGTKRTCKQLIAKERYRCLKNLYLKKWRKFSKRIKKIHEKRKRKLDARRRRYNVRRKLALKRRKRFLKKSADTQLTEIDQRIKRLQSGKTAEEFQKIAEEKRKQNLTDKKRRTKIRAERQRLKKRITRARKCIRKLNKSIKTLTLKRIKIQRRKKAVELFVTQLEHDKITTRLTKQQKKEAKDRKKHEKMLVRKKRKLREKKLHLQEAIFRDEAKEQRVAHEAQEKKYKRPKTDGDIFEQVKDTLVEEAERVYIPGFRKRLNEVKEFERKLLKQKQEQTEHIDSYVGKRRRWQPDACSDETEQEIKDAVATLEDGATRILPRIYVGCRHDVMRYPWREFVGSDTLGEHGYTLKLNFDPNFQRIVSETELIEELGFPVPKEMLCLATLKKQLYIEKFHVESIVNTYRELVSQMTEPQRASLKHFIVEIENLFHIGLTEHTWSSISLIQYCHVVRSKLESLSIVMSQVKEVERSLATAAKIVQKIEFFSLKLKKIVPFDVLYSKVDKKMLRSESQLAAQYDNMTPAMCKLEMVAGLGYSGKCEQMVLYYRWAEKTFFEALTIMVLQNCLHFQEFILGKTSSKFQITVRLGLYDIQTQPPLNVVSHSLYTLLDKFLEKLSHFPRWFDGTCHPVPIVKNLSTNVTHQYTYAYDVIEVGYVLELIERVYESINFVISKADDHLMEWQKYSHLWKINAEKCMKKFSDDKPMLSELDECFSFYHNLQAIMRKHKGYVDIHCIRFKVKPLVNNLIAVAGEWKNKLAQHLVSTSLTSAKALSEIFENMTIKLCQNVSNLQTFQEVLQSVKEIGDLQSDVDSDFKYIFERMHLVHTWKCKVSEKDKSKFKSIRRNYAKLRLMAKYRMHSLAPVKKIFYNVTKTTSESYKLECLSFIKKYKKVGPGTCKKKLKVGLELIPEYENKFNDLLSRYTLVVQAERNFCLKPSNLMPFFNAHQEFCRIKTVYDIYERQMIFRDNWSKYLWVNVVPKTLMERIEEYLKEFKNLPQECRDLPIAAAIEENMKEFKHSIPLMIQLKHPAIRDRHWQELMDRTGKHFVINPETFTLENMFSMNLHLFEDIIEEIVWNSTKELAIENGIHQIAEEWSEMKIPLLPHVPKNNFVRGYKLGSLDKILTDLDDGCMTLQSLGGSQFAAPFLKDIHQWEKNLTLINEVLTEWITLQTKWMYLEGIFLGGDIREQLPAQARQFEDIDHIFLKIMEITYQAPQILSQCLMPGRLNDIVSLTARLNKCQKSIIDLLNEKRDAFARFYFLSDDELLSILGSSDPKAVQEHIVKLFDNVRHLKFHWADRNDPKCIPEINGLISCEEEILSFRSPVYAIDKVELWMNAVLNEMRKSNNFTHKHAIFDFGMVRRSRAEWMTDFIGMAVLAANAVWWTLEVEYAFRGLSKGQNRAMKNLWIKLNSQLDEIVIKVRGDLTKNERKKCTTVLTVDVHARDIVETFVSNNVTESKAFAWESQLRFYWIDTGIFIKQCSGEFSYGDEYMGLNERLVITPLTDRIYLTITQALSMQLGGAPAGPAGTGKTETVKDLAKAMGLLCIVTNCGEGMDHLAFLKILTGLCQCGSWGCFDEFNRIDISVLSVISTQLQTIRTALQNKSEEFLLCDHKINLDPKVGVFITMNPGYAGRTELPESVKSLFRPAVCIVPDLEKICLIMLFSEGFLQAKVLARKMTVLYKLSKEQLSKQNHYDFGLRALKSVLNMAGELKRNSPELPEDVLLMRALRDMNLPKFVFEDIPLFNGLINDLFPGLQCPRVTYSEFSNAVEKSLDEDGYVKLPAQIDKIVQLYETMKTRHSVMIVGPTGGGKSVILKTLASAQTNLGTTTKLFVLNPKACSVNELYGVVNPLTRDWTDGLLSKTFREINKTNQIDNHKYIVFDGDVDALWIENMNSVMDDNKILTLSNGERIRMMSSCALIFEVGDLQYASPATVSRAGMVYVDPKSLGYKPYWTRWVNSRSETGERICLQSLFDHYVPRILSLIFVELSGSQQLNPLKTIIPQTELNMITQLCYMLEALIPIAEEEFKVPKTERPSVLSENIIRKRRSTKISKIYDFEEHSELLEAIFLEALYASFGATLVNKDKPHFDAYVKKISSITLVEDSSENRATVQHLPLAMPTLYDYKLDPKNALWIAWKDLVPLYVHDKNKRFCDILVPTEDSTRTNWLLQLMTQVKRPVVLVGETGTSKTAVVMEYLRSLNKEKSAQLQLNFSSRTSANDLLKNVESSIEKHTKDTYGPPLGKKLIVFIDDLNMPQFDSYGTQQPIALLKLMIEKNGFYALGKDLKWKNIKDMSIIAAMGLSEGGRNEMDPRFVSLFSVFNMTFPSDSTITHIFQSILVGHTADFSEDIRTIISEIIKVTIVLYKNVVAELPPTPAKFHYIYNLRDLSRIIAGLLMTHKNYYLNDSRFLRVWRNEFTRVMFDRLISKEDHELTTELLRETIESEFTAQASTVMKDPLLYGDYRNALVEDEARYYEDLQSYQTVFQLFTRISLEYNIKKPHNTMSLVLFEDALDHLTRLHRVLRMDRGHSMLIGVGGCGKSSISRLSSFAAECETFSIGLCKGYSEVQFREDMKRLYKTVGVENKPTMFLFASTHIIEEGFLELINNMLTIGIIPSLFNDDEKDEITSQVRNSAKAEGYSVSKDSCWQYFLTKCRNNLHVVLSMNPLGDALRTRCRHFPGLVSSTCIDWMFVWPTEALYAVAKKYFKDVETIPKILKEPLIECLVQVHLSMMNYTEDFRIKLRRENYLTPKHYLDFINNYLKLMKEKYESIDQLCERLEGGLLKIAEASGQLDELSDKLAKQQIVIDEKTRNTDILMAEIENATKFAAGKKRLAKKKQTEMINQSKIIKRQNKEARHALNKALPDLEAAKLALSNLDKKDITIIRSYATPPEPVQIVCECVALLLNAKEVSWKAAKGVMADPYFIKRLRDLNCDLIPQRTLAQVQKCLKSSTKLSEMVSISSAGLGLLQFVKAVLIYCATLKDVKPKREKVQELELEYMSAERYLNKLNKEIDKTEEVLHDLNTKYSVAMVDKLGIQEEAETMKKRLNAADQLFSGLGRENTRWLKDLARLAIEKKEVIGNCFLSAAFLSYTAPFSWEFRQDMVYSNWHNLVKEAHIPFSNPFKLENHLADDVTISLWISEGLPPDELSIQNGILTMFASRFPICIDPQLQALNWIKKRESNRSLKILSFSDSDFLKSLELAIRSGQPVLFQEVDYVDPIVDNVLQKNIKGKYGKFFVELGDKEVEYDPNFRMYMTTKLPNPNLDPSVYTKAVVINYSVTLMGLEEQLLSVVVREERPDLEETRENLINETSQNKQLLKQLEDSLLLELATSTGNMLDSPDLVQTLDDTKQNATEVQKKLQMGTKTKADIEIIRNSYRPVAQRGAILFFILSDMSAVNPMYQFALNAYLVVFCRTLRKTPSDTKPSRRIVRIISCLTQGIYDYGCTGIFEKHKLLFSFQLAVKLEMSEGIISQKQMDFFIKGNVVIEKTTVKPPYPWISAQGWNDIQKLVEEFPETFHDLLNELESSPDDWKAWCDSDSPESTNMPNGFSKSFRPFEILMLMRCFRVDRIYQSVTNFVIRSMGEDYITPPFISLHQIYDQSSCTTPIMFILSPGSDPTGDIMKLSELGQMRDKFQYLSLGQDQEKPASKLVEIGASTGRWILLQNCHLLMPFIRDLEKILEKMTQRHPDFRLWLTTEPSHDFPIGVLQSSFKVVMEPPNRLNRNLRNTFFKMKNTTLTSNKHPAFKTLVYILGFFHAVVQERRKYGTVGWNINYDFNESDFTVSVEILNTYLSKAFASEDKKVPWDSLKYLIGEVMYGGRVIDHYDRRIVSTYMDEYMGDFIFDTLQSFYFYNDENMTITVPPPATKDEYLEHINKLPLVCPPGCYGLHGNAEIGYFTQATKEMWATLINLQPQSAHSGIGASREEIIDNLAEDILQVVPDSFEFILVRNHFETSLKPTNTVLSQELEKFNNLVRRMRRTLLNLKKALKGEIGMDEDLEEISNSLFNGLLPLDWRLRAQQTTKNLASWIDFFKKRISFFTEWILMGEPSIMWLPGLAFPEAYLTALVQEACREQGWSLDNASLTTAVTNFRNEDDVAEKPQMGCYISGLFLEGARWDAESGCIAYAYPKVLIDTLPFISVTPTARHSEIDSPYMLPTPVYVTPQRRNAMGVGFVFEATLPIPTHRSFWILQGVCLLMTTDHAL